MLPPTPDQVSQRRIAVAFGVAVPVLAVVSPVTLIIGLFGSLAWIYVSIASTALVIPCGVVMAVKLRRVEPDGSRWQFTPPPGWPPPPSTDWVPASGWAPDPSWPTPPTDWTWWTPRTS